MNEINNETLKNLIKIVEKRIKTINANIATNQEQLLRVDKYDDLVNTINKDTLCFANRTFIDELEGLLSGIEIKDKEKLESLLEKIELLHIIATGINEGYYQGYTQDELDAIGDVINLILYFKDVSNEQKNEQRTNVTKSNQELLRCESLYDKLRNGTEGLEHFDEDISYVILLVKNLDPSFQRSVLVLIQELSKHVHENILKQMENDELVVISDDFEDEEEKTEEIDEDLIRGVFAKYGFNYDFFTEEHRLALSRISLIRIEHVLEVLSLYPEYQFVLDYQKRGQERNLFLVIRYATKETLEYLITDAVKRGVTVEEIFGVSGVYKKVSKNNSDIMPGGDGSNSESLTGTYEYYKKNADLFEKLSLQYNYKHPGSNVDFFKDALLQTPEVLALPSLLLMINVELAKQYDLKIVKKSALGQVHLYAATMYQSRHFAELCDVLIENDLYDYVSKYPSVLKEEKFVKKILYAKRKGKLERTNNGMIKEVRTSNDPFDLEVVVNRNNLDKYIAAVPSTIIDFVNDLDNMKYIFKLSNDLVMSSMDNHPEVQIVNDFTYNIKGVLVSRLKFRRIWYLMTMSGHMNEGTLNNLLMYALVCNSYYNDDQLSTLEEFVKGFNFGGIKYGLSN